ncbi:tetratricopeptide repeat family protein [Mycolicibacter arupensis]|uniref:Tetratricopeptide repeat family protein n=1 Tax=Mycolicibacter arupensis TaxID=342002 RepID=A0A0F5N4F4_9MYCO|nr:tetratricopeptide repeat family protein [Mycolicibacter arupensis]MCV7276361.1 SEC-C domain-containing protein [Mycolicibacter arupensis]
MPVTDTSDALPTLAAILTEHGPLSDEDIVERLSEAGITDPDAVADELLDEYSCPAAELPDGRWVWLPSLLAGRVFTHRLTTAEITHDLLNVTPDLDPITELCNYDGLRNFADGAPATIVLPDYDEALLAQRGIAGESVDASGALLLEPGTLAGLGVAAGDLVGLRLTDDGIALEPVTATADPTLGAQLAALLDADAPAYFAAVVWALCADHPSAFITAPAPLSEIVDEHGLTRHEEQLAPAGFDFARWEFENTCARLAARYRLDPDDAFVLTTLIEVHGQMARMLDMAADEGVALDGLADDEPVGGPFADILGELGSALADPLLAEILMEETTRDGRHGAAALGLFAETMEPKVPRAARVATRWLHAVAYERLGDIDGCERELLAAESMNPDWPLPLFDLARIASDRGDAETGLGLLRRAGADADHPLVHLLERHRAQPRTDVGRNEPCWCGSGRKYKKCHLGNEQLALADRVAWLYAKAQQHVLQGEWRDLVAAVGYERTRYSEDQPDDRLAEALADPLAIDAVLFEGGAFEEFLALRGGLLPDDERVLAQQWLGVERSVFDVEQVRPGRGLTLRDVRTGEVHEVTERTASRILQPGQLICARVVPTGEGMEFFGGVEPVALHERGPLIELLDTEPDPMELVAFLTRRFAPPALVNTEGDPMVICEAQIRVGDPVALAAELDECYERTETDPPQWIEFVTTDGMQRVRATLALDGDTVAVDTNSDARMDRVLVVLRGIDPALEILDETRTPIGDLKQAAAVTGDHPVAREPEDPELLAFMEQVLHEYEERWLDESIPALGGITPRQAADDPTRRGDLIRLLNSFPSGAAAGRGMDADRLRAALGLV